MNHAHLRLVKPAPGLQTSAALRGTPAPEGGQITDEEVDALASDPAEILARELGRTVKRAGPLPADRAVLAVRKVARAVMSGHAAGLYLDTGSHVVWLGAVLHYALTGRAPQLGARPGELPAAPSSLAPYPVDPAVDAFVSKCLSPRRADRFATVAELAEALAALPAGEDDSAYDDERESAAELTGDGRPSHTQLQSIPPISGFAARDWHDDAGPRLVRAV